MMQLYRRIRTTLLACAGTVALSNCSSHETEPVPVTPGLTVRLNGDRLTSDTINAQVVNPTPGDYGMSVSFPAANYEMGMQLSGISSTGTYPLGTSNGVSGGTFILFRRDPERVWLTPASGAAGTITITSLTATRMSGSFKFRAKRDREAIDSIISAEAVFDVPVRQLWSSGSIPDWKMSRIETSIQGVALTPVTIFAELDANVFRLYSSNPAYSLHMVLSGVNKPGTYVLHQGGSASWLFAARIDEKTGRSLSSWGGYDAANDGSVTIESITTTRVAGTFTATLGAFTNTANGPLVIGGKFDVGLQPR